MAVVLVGCSEELAPLTKPKVRPVKLHRVENVNQSAIHHFPGKVIAADPSELAFRIPGQLIELPIREGQAVEQGQLLARLDEDDARNQLDDRQSAYDLAKVDFERKKTVLERELIAPSVFDESKARLQSAKAALNLAQDNLRYTEIKAPYKGSVARIEVENFQYVQAKQPILVLQSDEHIDITIQVPEAVIGHVREDAEESGYRPQVTFPSVSSRTFLVDYKEHTRQADPATQSFKVTFTMIRPKGLNILPGMTAEIMVDFSFISTRHVKLAPIAPHAAVVRIDNEEQAHVWVYDSENGKVTKRPVILGRVMDEGIEVISGLSPGDYVVTAGVSFLKDGMQVRPLTRERGL
jgi:RND family efflux transporter MFP subunit